MEEFWGADRATGSGVRTTRQARHQCQQQRLEVDLKYQMEYVPDPPLYEGGTYPTPPSPPAMDEYSPGPTQSQPSVPSCGTSSSRGSKRKAPMVDLMDSQFEKLTTKLDGFMDVMGSGNSHFENISQAAQRQVVAIEKRNEILIKQVSMMRRMTNFQYSESDIWEMLSAMNIPDENVMDQCYDFLCANPGHTKRLMGLPSGLRWNKLVKMMRGTT